VTVTKPKVLENLGTRQEAQWPFGKIYGTDFTTCHRWKDTKNLSTNPCIHLYNNGLIKWLKSKYCNFTHMND
jgi:hypothetical protein